MRDSSAAGTGVSRPEGKSEPSGWTVSVPAIPLYRHAADFTAPEEPGRYLCIAEVRFAADTAQTVSEFVFAFEVLGPDGTAEPVPLDCRVILHGADGDYTPELKLLYARDWNLASSGLPIQPQEAAAMLTEDMRVTLPVEFEYGDSLREQLYSICTLQSTKPVSGWLDAFVPPEEPGEYLCIGRVTFAGYAHELCLQYVFAFEVKQTERLTE